MSELRVPDHWREELHPKDERGIRPGISLSVMRLADGGDPGWMQPMPDHAARSKLAGFAPKLKDVIRSWADRPTTGLPFHLDCEIRGGVAEISPWLFVGTTLDDNNLRLWFSTEGWFSVPGGTFKFDTDIVTLRFPRSLVSNRFVGDDDLLTDPFAFAGASW